jgi:hypothetical protein
VEVVLSQAQGDPAAMPHVLELLGSELLDVDFLVPRVEVAIVDGAIGSSGGSGMAGGVAGNRRSTSCSSDNRSITSDGKRVTDPKLAYGTSYFLLRSHVVP